MSPFDSLPTALLTEAIGLAPDTVAFSAREFAAHFGLTGAEVLAEMRAGRLIPEVRPSDRRRRKPADVIIPVRAYVGWIAHRQTPMELLQKVEAHLAARP